MAKDKMNASAGSISMPGDANTMRPGFFGGDPSVPPTNAFRPMDGPIVNITPEHFRVMGSQPAADPRDPANPQPRG